jgi:pilus assembly protein FimV
VLEAPPSSLAIAAEPEAAVPVPAGALTPVESPAPAAPTLMESLASNPTLFWGGVAGLLALAGGFISIRRRQPVGALPPAERREDAVSTVVPAPREAADEVSTTAAVAESTELVEPTSESSRGEDPMAEVNVYLAYERFEQAEELARRAIEAYPDRHDYKLKLLEIHYAAKNAEAFEADAADLHAAAGAESPLMAKVRAWWSDLNPGWALFAVSATASRAAHAQGREAEVMVGFEEPELSATLARAAFGIPEEADRGVDVPTGTVDFDLGLQNEISEASGETSAFDLDLNLPTEAGEDSRTLAGIIDLDVSDEALAAMMSEATQSLDLDLATGGGESIDSGLARVAGGAAQTVDALDLDLEMPEVRAPGAEVAALDFETLGTPLWVERIVQAAAPDEPLSVLDLELEPVVTRRERTAPATDEQLPVQAGGELRASELAEEADGAEARGSSAQAPGAETDPGGVLEEVLETLRADAARLARREGGQGAQAAPPGVDFELELDAGGLEGTNAFLEEAGDLSLDEVGTKLDLARAYIDMGDTEGARGILSEVLSEGDNDQRGDARELLARLA